MSNTCEMSQPSLLDEVFSSHRVVLLKAALNLGIFETDLDEEVPLSLISQKAGIPPDICLRLLRPLDCVYTNSEGEIVAFKSPFVRKFFRFGREHASELIEAYISDTYFAPILSLDKSMAATLIEEREDKAIKFYKSLEEEPRKFKELYDTLDRAGKWVNAAFANKPDLLSFNNILDVGGGSGALMKKVKENHPRTQLTVLEKSDNGIQDKEYSEIGLNILRGDLFRVPAGSWDLVILKWVLHDWCDHDAVKILRSIFRATSSGTKVVVIECLLEENLQYSTTAMKDVFRLLFTGGRERPLKQFQMLAEEVGYVLDNVQEIRGPGDDCAYSIWFGKA